MTTIRWNHHTSEWTATLPEGTQVHSHSYREVEGFLTDLQRSPAARRRENVANAVTVVVICTIGCTVTAAMAWLGKIALLLP